MQVRTSTICSGSTHAEGRLMCRGSAEQPPRHQQDVLYRVAAHRAEDHGCGRLGWEFPGHYRYSRRLIHVLVSGSPSTLSGTRREEPTHRFRGR